MDVFEIPKKVCKKIIDAIAKFWWGDDEPSFGTRGGRYDFLKKKVEWDLGISTPLILQCYQSRFGVSWTSQILYV
jgi:hypothetical protein